MKHATVKLLSATGVTFLDFFVATQCGPIVWHAWNLVPLARMGLLLLAGAIAFTLMDIWSKTLMFQGSRLSNRFDPGTVVHPGDRCKITEASDV